MILCTILCTIPEWYFTPIPSRATGTTFCSDSSDQVNQMAARSAVTTRGLGWRRAQRAALAPGARENRGVRHARGVSGVSSWEGDPPGNSLNVMNHGHFQAPLGQPLGFAPQNGNPLKF